MVKAKALETALLILEQDNDPASPERIKRLIRSSLEDRSLVVRSAAVNSIERLKDRQQFVPVLEQVAKTDPAKLPGKSLDGGDGYEYYPVRYVARRVLRQIQNGNP